MAARDADKNQQKENHKKQNKNLFCKFCQHYVDWKCLDVTTQDHMQNNVHAKNKEKCSDRCNKEERISRKIKLNLEKQYIIDLSWTIQYMLLDLHWREELCRRGRQKPELRAGQQKLCAEMSLCLFKGQQNQWAHFLRHGSDLSQWHKYQSRAGSVLCLAARHICLLRSRPGTEAVYLLSNVTLRPTPAGSRHWVIHKLH